MQDDSELKALLAEKRRRKEAQLSGLSQNEAFKNSVNQPQQHVGIAQGIYEGVTGAFPRAAEMLGSGVRGFADMASSAQSGDMFKDALAAMLGTKTQEQQQQDYLPSEAARDIGSGLMKGGRALGNAPGNALNWMGRELGTNPLDIRLPDSINNFDYDKFTGAKGGRAASDLMQGTASFVPALGASLGNPYLAMAIQSIGENENPITNMLGGRILHEGAKVAPKVYEGAKTIAKKGGEVVSAPFKAYNEHGALEKSKLAGETEILNAEQRKSTAQQAIEDIFKEHLPKKASEGRVNAAIDIMETKKPLQETGSIMYEDFNKTKNEGQKRIFQPIEPQFFKEQYHFPEGALSETTQNLINKTIGKYSETSKRNPLTGQLEFKVEKQSAQPKVEDYVNLQKHLRDEAAHLRKQASSKDMSKGDADIKHDQAHSLDRLRTELNNRINGSISEKAQTKYQGIQNFWKDYVAPFSESPTLENMSGNHPSVKTNKILESLSKEGHQKFVDIILENEKVRESIGKHDWRKVAKTPKALQEALESDLGKTLPENVRKSVQDNYDILVNEAKTIEKIKDKLSREGLKKSEVDSKISKYKTLAAASGGLSGLLYAAKLLAGIF